MSGDELIKKVSQILDAVAFPADELARDDECGPRWITRVPTVLLTLSNVSPSDTLAQAAAWNDKQGLLLKNKQLISLYNERWNGNVGSGSYDYFYRCTLRYLIESGLAVANPDKPDRPINSPARVYGLTEAARNLLHNWEEDSTKATASFLAEANQFRAEYVRARQERMIAVNVGGNKTIMMEGDGHNRLQKRIVEEFLPHFIGDFEVLYIAESENKTLKIDQEKILALGLEELLGGELPDIVAYCKSKDWIIIIEAFHTAGAITTSRLDRLKRTLGKAAAKTVFVTAFDTRSHYKQYCDAVAWRTEVWIAEEPTNMIHHDGIRFLGPYPA